jgi:hypothetical protein
MSVSVSKESQIMENLKLGDKTMTGVGAQLEMTLTDKGGNPISGSVTESNKEGGMQNPGAVTLTNGSFQGLRWEVRGRIENAGHGCGPEGLRHYKSDYL